MSIAASFFERVVAYLIDILFLQGIVALVIVLFVSSPDAFVIADQGNRGGIDLAMVAESPIGQYIIQNLYVVLGVGGLQILVTAFMLSQWTVTLGKKVMGIHVVDEDGRHISFGKALIRELGKLLSLLVVGLGFIWMMINPKKRAWHDVFAQSIVLRSMY